MRTQIKEQPFETQGHDFSGLASLDLDDANGFYKFLANVAEYDSQRYDPVAIKVFFSEKNPTVTLFVVDKEAKGKDTYPEGKLPVRKLKLALSWSELFSFVRRFDIVVATGNYNIADMVVINE